MSSRRLLSTLRPGLGSLVSSSSSSGACDIQGAVCPLPVTPETVWCGPSRNTANAMRTLRSLFFEDMKRRHYTNYVEMTMSEGNKYFPNQTVVSSEDGRFFYKMETHTDTKDGNSMIRVKFIKGLSGEEELDRITDWRAVLKSNSKK